MHSPSLPALPVRLLFHLNLSPIMTAITSVCTNFRSEQRRNSDKVILSYDLEIIPVLMRFKSHDEVEFPLNAVDPAVVAKWLDDRIVDFVQTYFEMGETEIYLKDDMVEDPIAHVRFPKAAAATKLDWQGHTFYFIGEETRREFCEQNKVRVE
jgi:YHS domain-containing protein